jgi:hypothetical protein
MDNATLSLPAFLSSHGDSMSNTCDLYSGSAISNLSRHTDFSGWDFGDFLHPFPPISGLTPYSRPTFLSASLAIPHSVIMLSFDTILCHNFAKCTANNYSLFQIVSFSEANKESSGSYTLLKTPPLSFHFACFILNFRPEGVSSNGHVKSGYSEKRTGMEGVRT